MNQEKQSEKIRNGQNSNKPLQKKLAYHPPQFISYGSVSKLTRGTTGSAGDGVSGMAALM